MSKTNIPTIVELPIGQVKMNPDNPRIISDAKFKRLVKSIQDFPQMLLIRPIVINKQKFVIGGNMRLKACREAGLKTIPTIEATNLTAAQQKEFMIKDNTNAGEWEFEILKQKFDGLPTADWGLEMKFNANDYVFGGADTEDAEDKIPKVKAPKGSDDNYSVFELIMNHENKMLLVDTLQKIKEEQNFMKQEDALMYLIKNHND